MKAGDDPPIVTLTSDFGLADWYVAAMKAALLRGGRLELIDITHQIPAGDVVHGSVVVERAVDAFGAGTTHLAVVDPGVGSKRRMLVVRCREQLVVCPDNGLITWAVRRQGPAEFFELTWRPQRFSQTFHGRDIMAPAAGALARGADVSELSRSIDDPVLLDLRPAELGANRGAIIYCDHFGNAITNIPRDVIEPRPDVRVLVGGRDLGRVRGHYSQAESGEALALIGSSGLLEISIRDGYAAQTLGLKPRDEVVLLD